MPDRTRSLWHTSRVRLSVRTLMALVLIIAGGLGWVAYRARIQRQAVALILGVGGNVTYDDPSLGGANPSPMSRALASLRNWVAQHLGDDYCRTVTWVDLQGADIGDEGVAGLGAFDQLQYLDLSG